MIARRTLIGRSAALALLVSALPVLPLAAAAPEEILLWPGTPPGRGGVTGAEKIGEAGAGFGAVSNIATSRMRVYRPETPNGAAVLVAGGGGYFRIQLWKESTPAAQWLQAQGFTVFELIYRLPNDGWDASAPFMDAQRAMKIIRSRAGEFAVDPARIGIMGFSAGGHLAGFTALQPGRALYTGADVHEQVSARPDFTVLLFPVVSLRKPFDTTRTRREIIGNKPSAKAEAEWSLDTYVSAAAPPTIIFAAADDPITPPGHSVLLFEKL
ncbi:alpha/beta hydrolase, partial [Blastomonas sp.]|uniref:alpha/beta hydrolase n=1 Tax=Blastomonas sp. TaxID=1909299 RepID=UPI003593E4D6